MLTSLGMFDLIVRLITMRITPHMTIPKSPGRFNKIAKLLNEVIGKGEEARLTCKSPKEATRVRFECYAYRMRLRKDLAKDQKGVDPDRVPTPYDNLIIKIEDSTVVFSTNEDLSGSLMFTGKLLDLKSGVAPAEKTNAKQMLAKYVEYGKLPAEDMWNGLVDQFGEGEAFRAFTEAGLSPPAPL